MSNFYKNSIYIKQKNPPALFSRAGGLDQARLEVMASISISTTKVETAKLTAKIAIQPTLSRKFTNFFCGRFAQSFLTRRNQMAIATATPARPPHPQVANAAAAAITQPRTMKIIRFIVFLLSIRFPKRVCNYIISHYGNLSQMY